MRRWLPVLGLLLKLARNRVWWAGLSLNVLGFLFHSAALHLSSIGAALTAMTSIDPIASWLWGAILFDQVPPTTAITLGGRAFSGLLIAGGVALLAHSPTMTRSYA